MDFETAFIYFYAIFIACLLLWIFYMLFKHHRRGTLIIASHVDTWKSVAEDKINEEDIWLKNPPGFNKDKLKSLILLVEENFSLQNIDYYRVCHPSTT